MHDIRAIRENPEIFDAALARRGLAPMSSEILRIWVVAPTTPISSPSVSNVAAGAIFAVSLPASASAGVMV